MTPSFFILPCKSLSVTKGAAQIYDGRIDAITPPLTTVNLVKALAKERESKFSMASCKLMIHNACLLERFIHVFGIRPNRRLNDKLVKELIEFEAIAHNYIFKLQRTIDK
ncbi:MAG: hypothetical protein LBE13_11085 [Bacteroidales bacterium]|jgi:hypothetical protein|nr:hypothetical protein [Bacteroidales bacterium]